MNPDNARLADETAFLVALAEHGIPPDLQEVLVRGDVTRHIPPGALGKALTALRQQVRAVPGGLDLDAAAQRFRYEHTNACYPDATEFEAREAAEQIVAAALSTQPLLTDDEFIHRAPTSVDPSLEGPGVVPNDVRQEGREQTAAIAFLAVWYDWHGDPKSWWDALAPDDRFRAMNAAATMLETLCAEIGRAVAVEREECAKVSERLADKEAEDFNEQAWAEAIATAIRARATLAGEGE